MKKLEMGEHSEDVAGVWVYAPSDILSRAIVLELDYSGLACGPVDDMYIHLSANIMDVANKCGVILNDHLNCGFIEFGDYKEYALAEFLNNEQEINDQHEIIENWTQHQTERFENLIEESKKTIELKTLLKLKDIVEDYRFCDIVRFFIMKDWVKDNQDFLLSNLIEYDEDGNEILPSQKELTLKRDKKLIAKAINYYNIESKQ
jgi:hypothetical protein